MVIISIILIYLIGVYISYRFFKHIVKKEWEDYDEYDEKIKRETFVKLLTIITITAINIAFDNKPTELAFWFVLVIGVVWGVVIAYNCKD